jgi:hypothetical protein
MHVTTKEVDQNGTHILTSVVEGDGPNPICSENAKLTAKVISISRSSSGGVQVQTSLTIEEPAVSTPVAADPNADVLAYLKSKGQSPAEAQANLAKFGAERIRGLKAKEDLEAQAKLDEELAATLAPKGHESVQ